MVSSLDRLLTKVAVGRAVMAITVTEFNSHWETSDLQTNRFCLSSALPV